MSWTEFNRYSWTTFMSPGDLLLEKDFAIRGYLFPCTLYNLAERGFCAYIRSKRYPTKPGGSTRIIFKCGKSQIVCKFKRYFVDKNEFFRYLSANDAWIDHIQDEIVVPASKPQGFFDSIINPQKPVVKPDVGLDAVYEKYTMNELLEFYNDKKFGSIRDHIKKTPIIKLVKEEIADEEAFFKEAS